jgi:hypothetical protein
MAKGSKSLRNDAKGYPSADEIRAALIKRAAEFCAATGMSKTALGKAAVNDPAFFAQVEDGRNFTNEMYRRAMAYMDAHPPRAGRSEPKRKSA